MIRATIFAVLISAPAAAVTAADWTTACDNVAASASSIESAHQAGVKREGMQAFIDTAFQDDMPGMALATRMADRSWSSPRAASKKGRKAAERESGAYWRHLCLPETSTDQ